MVQVLNNEFTSIKLNIKQCNIIKIFTQVQRNVEIVLIKPIFDEVTLSLLNKFPVRRGMEENVIQPID